MLKLILCRSCEQVYSLEVGKEKRCKCNRTGGTDINVNSAVFWGRPAVPLVMDGTGLTRAVAFQNDLHPVQFNTWVWTHDSDYFHFVDAPADATTPESDMKALVTLERAPS